MFAQTIPTFDVRRPTILAFFPPMSDADMAKNPDMNEALSDFQLYASQSKEPLAKIGVDFQQVYARSFRVRVGASTTTFRPTKAEVGYYFIAPGKKPLVKYGVMTDTDLSDLARRYFGNLGGGEPPKLQIADVDACEVLHSPQQFIGKRIRFDATLEGKLYKYGCSQQISEMSAEFADSTDVLRRVSAVGPSQFARADLKRLQSPQPEKCPPNVKCLSTRQLQRSRYQLLNVRLVGRVYRWKDAMLRDCSMRADVCVPPAPEFVFIVDEIEDIRPGPELVL
jgi:hypothetical protein